MVTFSRNVIRACAAAGMMLASTVSGDAVPLCYESDWCVRPSTGDEHRMETQAFAGLQWNFGDSTPELVIGVRRTQTDNDDEVIGGKIDLTLKLNEKILSQPMLRFVGLAGNRDVQGELAIGVKGFALKPVVGAGVQAPFANAGVNYVFGEGFQIYAGFNSLKKPEKPKSGGTMSCPADYILIDAPMGAAPSDIANGKTCAHLV
jgi:hypothetical protein